MHDRNTAKLLARLIPLAVLALLLALYTWLFAVALR